MPHYRTWSIIRRVWITLGLTATLVFTAWSLVAYRANSEARHATDSDAQVTVDRAEGYWLFAPADDRVTDADLLFFPGALVDPRAYAPLGHAVARAGYRMILVELPRRGAFGGANSPELRSRVRVALTTNNATRLVVAAGHSRGAVVASRVVAENPAAFAGLVLIGSSHPRDHDLSSLSVPVAKVVGTRDGLASPEKVRANAALLPAHAQWVWIEGGNHSQFGWYGFQPLDRRPRVDASAQRQLMIEAVLAILRAVD